MFHRYRSMSLSLRSICQHIRYRSSLHTKIKDVKYKPIDKVLIANRGEIACCVMRTARKLGIRTVAVYSEADENSLHVEMADEAYCIGPAPSSQSYLDAGKVLNVVKMSGSQAVHPGYGFLSENQEFSERCKEEDVIFIGPPSKAIRDMGIKSTSKKIMQEAGVPVIEGYHGDDQTIERLISEANKIGFPLMIKAVRGGGGKGMRIAFKESEFLEALESAKRESLKSFGDDNVLLEQYVTDPRHVEVQVFADKYGNAVHLFERDCSVQRRHQKIIEEAPAPGISEAVRSELGAAGVRAALAVGYVSAGTVEFILDRYTHSFHFMEMNTRLQVEHPITEMITGVDLVEWQFRIASGEPLPLQQSDLVISGHAVESRIYAENPRDGFLPGAGHLEHLKPPEPDNYTRVETGVRQGDDVSVHYDPMIAKLVVWAPERRQAFRTMRDKLALYQIGGLETNVDFLITLCNNESILNGDLHTAFIEQHKEHLFPEPRLTTDRAIQATLAHILTERRRCESNGRISLSQAGWRLNYKQNKTVTLKYIDKEIQVNVQYSESPNDFIVSINNDNDTQTVSAYLDKDGCNIKTCINGKTNTVATVIKYDKVYLFHQDGKTVVELADMKKLTKSKSEKCEGTVRSPMPGVLERISVDAGQVVSKGDALYVIVAMKMEYTVRSPKDARVVSVANLKNGESVFKGQDIVILEDIVVSGDQV